MNRYNYDEGLEHLRIIGGDYARKNLFKPEKEDVSYNPNMLAIGRRIVRGREVGKYYLDLREACRIIVVGATRSGKSFLIRRMTDTLVDSGNCAVNLFDCKDEMKSSIEPLQPKFHSLLMENEEPKPTKVVTLRPTFFKQLLASDSTEKEFDELLPKDNYWYSININKLTERDFNDLVQTEAMSDGQRVTMKELYDDTKKQSRNGIEFSFANMLEKINSLEDMTQKQKDSLKKRLRPLLTSHFYEFNHEIDVIDLINDGFVPSINMENFDAFSNDKNAIQYHVLLLSILHRELIMAKRAGKINGKLWIFIDESARVLGNDLNNAFKFDVTESFEVNTRYNVNYCVATQTLITLPKRLILNSKYMFIPATINLETLKDCMREFGMFSSQQNLNNEAVRLKRKLNAKKFEWAVFNRNAGTVDIIQVYAPLSKHMETGNY